MKEEKPKLHFEDLILSIKVYTLAPNYDTSPLSTFKKLPSFPHNSEQLLLPMRNEERGSEKSSDLSKVNELVEPNSSPSLP